jgi:hypothetical protein
LSLTAFHASNHANAQHPVAVVANAAPPNRNATGTAIIANALPKYIPLVIKLTARFLSCVGIACASIECIDGNTVPIAPPTPARHHQIARVRLPSLGVSALIIPQSANAHTITLCPPILVASAPPGTCVAVYPL